LKTAPSENVEGYWAFHISEGTVFNHCKIQAKERPENTKGKITAAL
jgi:hypothetical protein